MQSDQFRFRWGRLLILVLMAGLMAPLISVCTCLLALSRPKPLPPAAVSPVVSTPDGSLSAQVWRRETQGGSMGSPPIRYSWILQVASAGRTLECGIGGGADSQFDVAANRAVRFELTWMVPGWTLSVNSGPQRGGQVVYLLDNGLIPTYHATPVTGTPLPLTKPLHAKLRRLNRPDSELERLRYVQLHGGFMGALSKDFVNEREDVLLVAGPDFTTHGQIVSKGPIVLIGEAHAMGDIGSNQWVFADDYAMPRGRVVAPEVYLADSAQARQATLETPPVKITFDLPGLGTGDGFAGESPRYDPDPRRRRWPVFAIESQPAPTATTLTQRLISPMPITDAPAALTPDLRRRIAALNLPEAQVSSLKYVRLKAGPAGARWTDFTCSDSNVLVVLDDDACSSVASAGPILCMGTRVIVNELRSLKWIFIDGDTYPHRLNAPTIYVNRKCRVLGTLSREPVLLPADPEADDYLQLKSQQSATH